jgi:hypothetical protein
LYALQLPIVGAKVGLFTNFYQPQEDSTLASFDAPIAPGLTEKPLPAAIRGGLNVQGRAVWTWPVIDFVAAGGGLPVQVWGYYVYCTDPLTSQLGLLWAQRLVSSFGFVAPGDTLPINLTLSFGEC